MPFIEPSQRTLLKLRPLDSSQLGANEIRIREPGEKLGICSVRKADNQHWEVKLAGKLTIGGSQVDKCFIFSGHWKGVTDIYTKVQALDRSVQTQSLNAPPQGVYKTLKKDAAGNVTECVLNVPYASQTDNANNPGGSCNVTSMSMALRFFSIKQRRSGIQFEDELYEYMTNNGLSRHSPQDLKIVAEEYGLTDRFIPNASKQEIKDWLVSGRPVVVHGYFTAFGHICVIVGFDEKGWILHDPWGEYPYGDLRNDGSNPSKGAYIRYSYGLMGNCCWSDGGCWTHFLDRPGYTKPTLPQTQHTVNTPTQKTATISASGSPRHFKPQEFRPNSIAAKFIGHFEGLELKQYVCSAGVSTIGIGTTRWFDGGPIPVGATITKEQAVELFKRDAAEFMAEIQRIVDVTLTARQIAAVLSFCYNCGWQGFEESSLAASINNASDFETIRINFRKWAKANGEVLPGLLRRRNAESMLWEGRDDWESAGFD